MRKYRNVRLEFEMMSKGQAVLHTSEKQVIYLHLAFTPICIAVLLAPVTAAFGTRMLFLVIVYNLMNPLWGRWRRDYGWIDTWGFALILSVFQVFPDWFLSAELNILVFPDDGVFRIGTVSGYMAGLWAIPVFLIVFVGERVRLRYSARAGYVAAGAIAFILFAGSEQGTSVLPMWHPVNVAMIGQTAIYIVIPEIILGISALYAFQHVKYQPLWRVIIAAFLVMQLYLGSAAFFYFIIEKILLL